MLPSHRRQLDVRDSLLAGAAVGVLTPMIFKASGVFQKSPDLSSASGLIVVAGVAVLVVGVTLAAWAGVGRERLLRKAGRAGQSRSGGLAAGLMMVIVAGVLSAGWGFAFAYSQDPIIKAMKAQGASELAANIGVWAFALSGAVLPNLLYPAWLLTRNRSWGLLWAHPGEIGLSVIYGVLFFAPSVLLGRGMLLLGAVGGLRGRGDRSGNLDSWRPDAGLPQRRMARRSCAPRRRMYAAIVLLLAALAVMAAGLHRFYQPANASNSPAPAKADFRPREQKRMKRRATLPSRSFSLAQAFTPGNAGYRLAPVGKRTSWWNAGAPRPSLRLRACHPRKWHTAALLIGRRVGAVPASRWRRFAERGLPRSGRSAAGSLRPAG